LSILLEYVIFGYANAQAQLQQVTALMHPRLDAVSSAALDALLAQDCACIEEASAHAWMMLQDQATIPIMDVVTVDAEGNATQVGTQPLFPIISEQRWSSSWHSLKS
jgi:hypothetical protein